jgi:hypothetical protein
MSARPTVRSRLWLGGLACVGVVLTHALAYAVAVPDPARRAALLEATGHGQWRLISALALGALVAALCGFAVDRATRPHGKRLSVRSLYRFAAVRLVVVQVLGFVALEAAERAAVGHVSSLAHETILPIGILLQLLFSLVGALVLVVLARTLDLLGELLFPRTSPATGFIWLPVPFRGRRPHLAPATGGPTLRGPPFCLSS